MRINTDSKALGLQEVKPSVAQENPAPSEDHTAAMDSFEKDALTHADYAYATSGARLGNKGQVMIEILPRANLAASWWGDLSQLIEQLPASTHHVAIHNDTMEAVRAMAALAPHRSISV